jgi:hypothetical protein
LTRNLGDKLNFLIAGSQISVARGTKIKPKKKIKKKTVGTYFQTAQAPVAAIARALFVARRLKRLMRIPGVS